ncbi:MAG: hypothetical protein QXG97_04505 [Nitrososphaerota archaeon]
MKTEKEKTEILEITSQSVSESEPKLWRLFEKLMSKGINERILIRVGTSGFRGRNDERLTRNIAAYSLALGECLGPNKKVIIGYDERPRSRRNALLCTIILEHSGLSTEIAKESITISCLAKTVLESNRKSGAEKFYGVMCGASHNPLTDNGMNFIIPDGSIAEEDFTNALVERVLGLEPRLRAKPIERKGKIKIIDPTEAYVNSIVSFVGEINRKDIIVVVDPLNGAGKKALPNLVKALGVDCHTVHRMGFEGMRDLDPRTNTEPIKAEIEKKNADLGVLIDGDGDRAMFVYLKASGKKRIVEADYNESFAAILDYLLTYMPVHAVSTNVASSSVFRDICQTHGITIFDKNPVGFKHQSKDMRRHPNQVVVGIEGNSGGFTVSSFSREKDGCLAAALAIKMIAETAKFADNISQLGDKYGKRYIKEISIKSPTLTTREKRRAVIDSLKQEFKVGSVFYGKEIAELITVDGVKLVFASGSSLLFRASGTEPKFRVISETKDKREFKMLPEAGREIIEEYSRRIYVL